MGRSPWCMRSALLAQSLILTIVRASEDNSCRTECFTIVEVISRKAPRSCMLSEFAHMRSTCCAHGWFRLRCDDHPNYKKIYKYINYCKLNSDTPSPNELLSIDYICAHPHPHHHITNIYYKMNSQSLSLTPSLNSI